MNDLLLEMMVKQQELSEQIKNRNAAENVEEEEGDEDEEEEDEDEEEDESPPPVSKQTGRAARARSSPRPSVGSNPAKIDNFTFSNQGSGTMYNRNVGNIVNTTFSNIGNNHSENHIYG